MQKVPGKSGSAHGSIFGAVTPFLFLSDNSCDTANRTAYQQPGRKNDDWMILLQIEDNSKTLLKE